jgi:hypothetical protein
MWVRSRHVDPKLLVLLHRQGTGTGPVLIKSTNVLAVRESEDRTTAVGRKELQGRPVLLSQIEKILN